MVRKTKVVISPVGSMVLIRHDDDQSVTSGGIVLPDDCKTFTLKGRIIGMPEKMDQDKMEYPFSVLDKVIYDTRNRFPVSLESGNKDFLIEAEDILAVVTEELIEDLSGPLEDETAKEETPKNRTSPKRK